MNQELETQNRWRLSGWKVLLGLVGFFGIIFLVNGVMIYKAISTMSGTDTDSAYQAGRMYEHEVAMARAQDARRWRVDATVTGSSSGARLDVLAHDAAGQPVLAMDATATFERPTDRRLDQVITLADGPAGHFYGSAPLAPGQWDVVIEISRKGEQMFRSRNRIVLK